MNNSQELNKIQSHKFDGRLIHFFGKKINCCCIIIPFNDDICFSILCTQKMLDSDQLFETTYNIIEYVLDHNIGIYLNYNHNIHTKQDIYWFRLIDVSILLELL